jgi:hypothetical protein
MLILVPALEAGKSKSTAPVSLHLLEDIMEERQMGTCRRDKTLNVDLL